MIPIRARDLYTKTVVLMGIQENIHSVITSRHPGCYFSVDFTHKQPGCEDTVLVFVLHF